MRTQQRDACVALEEILAIRASSTSRNALVSHPCERVSTGRILSIPRLQQLLHDHELGLWTISADVIEWLHRWILENRPNRVLEFSSGVSTLVIAHALQEIHPRSSVPRITSLEQDRNEVRRTEQLLTSAGLSHLAEIHFAPIGSTPFADSPCYDLSYNGLADRLSNRGCDLIVIDGPAGSRRATLPMAQSLISRRACFLLDDALRDGELADLQAWSALPGIELDGIRLLGKGIGCGWAEPLS